MSHPTGGGSRHRQDHAINARHRSDIDRELAALMLCRSSSTIDEVRGNIGGCIGIANMTWHWLRLLEREAKKGSERFQREFRLESARKALCPMGANSARNKTHVPARQTSPHVTLELCGYVIYFFSHGCSGSGSSNFRWSTSEAAHDSAGGVGSAGGVATTCERLLFGFLPLHAFGRRDVDTTPSGQQA